MIVIRCPDCEARLKVTPTAVGKKIKCPKCAGSIIVPTEEPEEEEAAKASQPASRSTTETVDPDGNEEEQEEEKPRRKKKANKAKKAGISLLVLGLLGGAALILGIAAVVIIIVALRGTPSTPVAQAPQKPTTMADDRLNDQELGLLQGTWNVIAIEAAGKPVAADRVQKINLQYVFDGNKMIVRRPDRADNPGTLTLDTASDPKKMTVTLTSATQRGNPPLRAVYAIEGNRLRICMMVDEKVILAGSPNGAFPSDLTSRASPMTDLLTLQRR